MAGQETVAEGAETRNSNYAEIGKSRIGPNSFAAKLKLKAVTDAPARIANWRPMLDASECAPHWMRHSRAPQNSLSLSSSSSSVIWNGSSSVPSSLVSVGSLSLGS